MVSTPKVEMKRKQTPTLPYFKGRFGTLRKTIMVVGRLHFFWEGRFFRGELSVLEKVSGHAFTSGFVGCTLRRACEAY